MWVHNIQNIPSQFPSSKYGTRVIPSFGDLFITNPFNMVSKSDEKRTQFHASYVGPLLIGVNFLETFICFPVSLFCRISLFTSDDLPTNFFPACNHHHWHYLVMQCNNQLQKPPCLLSIFCLSNSRCVLYAFLLSGTHCAP